MGKRPGGGSPAPLRLVLLALGRGGGRRGERDGIVVSSPFKFWKEGGGGRKGRPAHSSRWAETQDQQQKFFICLIHFFYNFFLKKYTSLAKFCKTIPMT